MPATGLPSQDEVLPQREPRQRRRVALVERTVPPNSTPTDSDFDEANTDRNIGQLEPLHYLQHVHEDSSCVESSSITEQRMGELPQYRSAAEGNFLFECESDGSETISSVIHSSVSQCIHGTFSHFSRLGADLDHTADIQIHACKAPDLLPEVLKKCFVCSTIAKCELVLNGDGTWCGLQGDAAWRKRLPMLALACTII